MHRTSQKARIKPLRDSRIKAGVVLARPKQNKTNYQILIKAVKLPLPPKNSLVIKILFPFGECLTPMKEYLISIPWEALSLTPIEFGSQLQKTITWLFHMVQLYEIVKPSMRDGREKSRRKAKWKFCLSRRPKKLRREEFWLSEFFSFF